MNKELSTTVKVRFSDCDPIGHLNNVKYLDYMFNAREDHVEEFYGFTYEEYTKKSGCTWIAVQNEIAYIREVRYNTQVVISSKTIEVGERTAKVEILMKSLDEKSIHAVLWVTVIYFNVKTRRSETHPQDIIETFGKFYVDLEQKDFQSRVKFLRTQNAKNS
ncbi:thioesterase [Chryseobacterium sp. Leaf404]|uniref:acyl-CoA thioesterase n=1 Tax=unclassified Chryseobacterium TaxID=2593645 RepID=UPI0006FE7BDF|nr:MULTISPECIES: acyl-CoA thioesterase [unclassified Chryseobacterium]KQT21959.1 thioesterase [Chryseobacterium sp. Leaf404]